MALEVKCVFGWIREGPFADSVVVQDGDHRQRDRQFTIHLYSDPDTLSWYASVDCRHCPSIQITGELHDAPCIVSGVTPEDYNRIVSATRRAVKSRIQAKEQPEIYPMV